MKLPSGKLVKINLNPRIALSTIGYGLKKVRSAGEGRVSIWIVSGQRFAQELLLDFRLLMRRRQNKRIMRLWCDLNGIPREQNEGIVIKCASVMNPNLSNPKRQVFRLVKKREAENMTAMVWIGNAAEARW